MKLKPCPFCGGEARITKHNAPHGLCSVNIFAGYRLCCLVCNAQKIVFTRYKSQAIGEWNHRWPKLVSESKGPKSCKDCIFGPHLGINTKAKCNGSYESHIRFFPKDRDKQREE